MKRTDVRRQDLNVFTAKKATLL